MSLPTIAEFMAAGMAHVRSQLPATVVYAGNTYTGGLSMTRRRDAFAATGEANAADFTLILLQADLATNSDNPLPNESITVNGTVYRIYERKADPLGVHYHFMIGIAYQ